MSTGPNPGFEGIATVPTPIAGAASLVSLSLSRAWISTRTAWGDLLGLLLSD
jgi:hypothetical protein